jgi:hypothetical protein
LFLRPLPLLPLCLPCIARRRPTSFSPIRSCQSDRATESAARPGTSSAACPLRPMSAWILAVSLLSSSIFFRLFSASSAIPTSGRGPHVDLPVHVEAFSQSAAHRHPDMLQLYLLPSHRSTFSLLNESPCWEHRGSRAFCTARLTAGVLSPAAHSPASSGRCEMRAGFWLLRPDIFHRRGG